MPSKRFVLLVAIAAMALPSCRKDPKAESRRLVAAGDKFMMSRKFDEAAVEYRAALVQDPMFGEAHLKLGNAYLVNGEAANARRELIRAADLLPASVEAQLQAGKVLLASGMHADAKARALKALETDPKNVEALMLMGNAVAGLKDINGAITLVQQAIDADPHRVLTYANLGALEQAKGNGAAAEAAFKRAVEIEPKSVSARLSLANYYWAANKRDLAEQSLKTAFQLDSASLLTNRELALFYIIVGRQSEGEKYLKTYADLATDVDPKLVLADYYLDTKRIPEAQAVLARVSTMPGGFVQAKLRLAAIEFVSNRHSQAYELLDEAFKREPKNEAALLEKARFLLSDKKPQEALAAANLALGGNPQSIPGTYLKALALEATGDPDEAIGALRTVLTLQPTAVPAQVNLARLLLARGDAEGAAGLLGESIKTDPRSGIAHFILAKSALQMGEIDRAQSEAMLVAKSSPASAEVQTLLGDCALAKHDVARAREAYTRALGLQSDSVEALAGMINADLAEKNFAAARSKIEARLKSGPQNSKLLTLAGATFSAGGDVGGAESMLRRAVDADPANIDAYDQLGRIYMSQRRLDEAKNDYESAARRQPKKSSVTAMTMVGIILSLEGKNDEARAQYERALAIDPRAAVAANNLAWDYADRGANLDMALQLAQTAKAQLPNSWQVSDTLGWIYYKKGLSSLSINTLREAAKQAPSNPAVLYRLGLACLQGGDKREARKALQQALAIGSQFPEATEAKRVLKSLEG